MRFGTLGLKWNVFLKYLPPQGSGIYMEEKSERFYESEVVDESKKRVSSRHSRTDKLTVTVTASSSPPSNPNKSCIFIVSERAVEALSTYVYVGY